MIGRYIKYLLCIVVLSAALFSMRAYWESYRWLKQARDQKKIDTAQALDSYRRSLSWSAPGAMWGEAAYLEAVNLVNESRLEGRDRWLALEEVKRGLWSGRSVLDSFTWRKEARGQIDQLIQAGVPVEEQREGVKQKYPTRLDYRFQIAAQIGFWGWIGSILAAIWSGFTAAGQIRWAPLIGAGISWGFFFAVWVVALRLA